MEFKFRAVDDRPPSLYYSPPSTSTCFYDQAFVASYSRIERRQNPELMRSEMLRREIEKERIREEMMALEILRRQELEAEVRRELMMEREMALRVGCFEERLTMQPYPTLPLLPFLNQFNYRWLEEPFAVHGHGRSDMFPRLPEAVVAREWKSAPEQNKDKLIVLTKPDPSICGEKRKAATPPSVGAAELVFTGLKKKPKEEWSCALCQVSATSERGLNEHLQGKKHKAKEAGLRAQKMAKDHSTAPLPKKAAKPATFTAITARSELEGEAEGESLRVGNRDDDSDQQENKIVELTVHKNQHAEKLKNKEGATMQTEKPREFRKKKFRFWCEMCQVGAFSEAVMDSHKKGKKHLARLQELVENCKVLSPTISIVAPLEASEKAEDSLVMSEEAIKNRTEIVIIDDDKTAENTAVNVDG